MVGRGKIMSRKPIRDIEGEVIQDFHDGMLSKEMEQKYGYTWATLRKILIKEGIPFRARGGYRENAGRKLGVRNKWGG